MENYTIPLNIIDGTNNSYELGKTFTWVNPDNVNQKGWGLNHETRSKLSDGTIDYFVIALSDAKVRTLGGLGGIEVILNSQINGFCIDYKSFPWYLDRKTRRGGYTSYSELLSREFTVLNSGVIYLKYDITSHPEYKGFIKDMISGNWGQICIQYGIGIKDLPLVNTYLIGQGTGLC
ncbi:MAG: hypothetical protein FWF68_00290 [Spirochaetes bacterium]|nr:hypothetical protein [Spirochaetota bacterium]